MSRHRWLSWTWDKYALSKLTGLSDDVLHILAGMLILTLAALVLRRPPWTWRPWLVVLVAECVNEAHDLTTKLDPHDEGNWAASFHDLWLTMLWPTVVLLVWRRWARAR